MCVPSSDFPGLDKFCKTGHSCTFRKGLFSLGFGFLWFKQSLHATFYSTLGSPFSFQDDVAFRWWCHTPLNECLHSRTTNDACPLYSLPKRELLEAGSGLRPLCLRLTQTALTDVYPGDSAPVRTDHVSSVPVVGLVGGGFYCCCYLLLLLLLNANIAIYFFLSALVWFGRHRYSSACGT